MSRPTQRLPTVLLARPESFANQILGGVIRQDGFNLVGRVSTLDGLLAEINTCLPDVVVLDASLARMAAPCGRTMKLLRQVGHVVVYMECKQADFCLWLDAKFDAYLTDRDPLEELHHCLRAGGRGGVYYGTFFRKMIQQLGVTGWLAAPQSTA